MNYQVLVVSVFAAIAASGSTFSSTLAQSVGQSTNATLRGTVIYPSEMLPAQKVCAENQQTHRLFCSETKQSQQEFSIPIKAGSYVVFATECNKTYRKNISCRDGYRSRRAYYNEHVKCGLTVECGQKHRKNVPIVIRIKAGQTIANIKPHDWYTKN
jgi:hypothetical protein